MRAITRVDKASRQKCVILPKGQLFWDAKATGGPFQKKFWGQEDLETTPVALAARRNEDKMRNFIKKNIFKVCFR